ncbi:MAG: hypothetical protein ACPG4N_12280 [Gammaproteobacteria bacterium]
MASAPFQGFVSIGRAMLLYVVLAMVSASALAAPKYISDYDVRRHLREDCRDIIRKAKFFISARCSFSLIAVDRGTGSVPAGMSPRPTEPADPDGDPASREQNYSPSLDIDLVRKEARLKAERDRRQAMADDATPRKGRYSHMRVLASAKGFVRTVTFEVLYRLKWTPSNLYTRKILSVSPARNLNLQLPSRGQAGAASGQRPGDQAPTEATRSTQLAPRQPTSSPSEAVE